MNTVSKFCGHNDCEGDVLAMQWRFVISLLVTAMIIAVYVYAVQIGSRTAKQANLSIDQNVGNELITDPIWAIILTLVCIVSCLINGFQKQDSMGCLLGSLGLPGTILGILWAWRFTIGG